MNLVTERSYKKTDVRNTTRYKKRGWFNALRDDHNIKIWLGQTYKYINNEYQ